MRIVVILLYTLFFFSVSIDFCLAQTADSSLSVQTDPPIDSSRFFLVGNITLIGNKTTKDRILFRELTLKKDDTVRVVELDAKLRRSEQNLFNTALFNSTKITYLEEGNKINLFVIVTERWYIFPLPIFEIVERNFNVWWQTKDWSRIVYGGVLNWNNFRGRNEQLAISLRLGYTQRVSFYYSIPYINRKQKGGLTFGFAYARNHETPLKTVDGRLTFFKDEDQFARREWSSSVAYTFRPNLYETHAFEVNYKYALVLDTVIRQNEFYFTPQSNKLNYLTLRYFFRSDHRDIAFYPLKGYYYDVELVKNGLPFVGDDVNIFYTTIKYKKYKQLGRKWYAAGAAIAKLTANTFVPYYLTRGLGYGREYLRGYEYYVIDGQNYLLLQSNLKFELIPKSEIEVPFIPLNKFATIPYAFYINLYADAGYVQDRQKFDGNRFANAWQYSGGIGIDFVTYYDMVFRFEYSINRIGETGFFLHFTSPI